MGARPQPIQFSANTKARLAGNVVRFPLGQLRINFNVKVAVVLQTGTSRVTFCDISDSRKTPNLVE